MEKREKRLLLVEINHYGIKKLFHPISGDTFKNICIARTVAEAIEEIQHSDVVLLELHEVTQEVNLLHQLKKLNPQVPIFVYSEKAKKDWFLDALKHGVIDFFDRDEINFKTMYRYMESGHALTNPSISCLSIV